MICKCCRQEIKEEDWRDKENGLCARCFDVKIANEYVKEIIPFLLKHNMEFKKIDFGSGEGFYLDLGKGIIINFFNKGRVDFEYDKELEETK